MLFLTSFWAKLPQLYLGKMNGRSSQISSKDCTHIALNKPHHSGTYYYKGFFLILLLGLVDANYRSLWDDIGGLNSQSDAEIYKCLKSGRSISKWRDRLA